MSKKERLSVLEQHRLRPVAELVRRTWVEERRSYEMATKGVCTAWGNIQTPQWDGGIDKNGKHHDCAWIRIAEFCEMHGFDPVMLVKAVFYRADYMPTPNLAYGQHAISKYQTYLSPNTKQLLRIKLSSAFEAEKAYTASNMQRLVQYGNKTEDIAVREIVLDPTTPLTNLFRYCVLKNRERPIAADFADAAFHQYMRSPALFDEVWGSWIPADIRERAAALQSTGGAKCDQNN